MPNLLFVIWELGSLRNGFGQLDLDVPADGLPLRSTAPGRDEEVLSVITEIGRSSRALRQELRVVSVTGELLATATGPMLCAVCKEPAMDARMCVECWVQRAWCDRHQVEVLEPWQVGGAPGRMWPTTMTSDGRARLPGRSHGSLCPPRWWGWAWTPC